MRRFCLVLIYVFTYKKKQLSHAVSLLSFNHVWDFFKQIMMILKKLTKVGGVTLPYKNLQGSSKQQKRKEIATENKASQTP